MRVDESHKYISFFMYSFFKELKTKVELKKH